MWRFLKKLEIELPYDPAIPLLGTETLSPGEADPAVWRRGEAGAGRPLIPALLGTRAGPGTGDTGP